MAAPAMSPEDEEALRQMLAEPPTTDLRSEGDPGFFADGAMVELFGLQGAAHLNGETCEVVGYDNDLRRYRLKLHSNGEIKKVGRKNMKAWTPAPAPPQATIAAPAPAQASSTAVFVPGAAPGSSSTVLVPGPQPGSLRSVALGPQPPVAERALAVADPAASASRARAPTRENVNQALGKLARDTAALQEWCEQRQRGIEREDQSICDAFLRINTAFETYLEIYELYKKAYGEDEELKQLGAQASERFDEVVNIYTTVRTWTELAQDEWNLTHYSIRKHGLVGTLKNEFIELGNDAVDITKDAGEVLQTAATTAAPLVRSATGTVGTVVSSGPSAIAAATGSVLDTGRRGARHVVEEQIVGPVKRAWHLLVTAFLLCFILPLFALRAYAPLNSVFANVGLVYSVAVLTCPPSWARRRGAKAGLLLLWPLFTVVMPLALHYWLMHPGMFDGLWPSGAADDPAGEDLPETKEELKGAKEALGLFRKLRGGAREKDES